MNLAVFKDNFKVISGLIIDSLLKERLQDGNIKETIKQAIEEINKGNLESIMELSVENLTSSRLRSNLNTERLLLQSSLSARQRKNKESLDPLNFKKGGHLTESQNFKRFVDEKLKSGDNLTSSFDDIAEDKSSFEKIYHKKKKDLLSFISEGENEDSLINSIDKESNLFMARKKSMKTQVKPIEIKNLQKFFIKEKEKKAVSKKKVKKNGIESWLFNFKTRHTTSKLKPKAKTKKFVSRQSLTTKGSTMSKSKSKTNFSPLKKNLHNYKSTYLKPIDKLNHFMENKPSYGLFN